MTFSTVVFGTRYLIFYPDLIKVTTMININLTRRLPHIQMLIRNENDFDRHKVELLQINMYVGPEYI